MTDFVFKRTDEKVIEQAIAVDPLTAFKKFVAPGLSDPRWIEDSSKITDTDMSKREWAGLVVHCFSLMAITKTNNMFIGKGFNGGDGYIVRIYEGKKAQNDFVYIEQTLATHVSNKGKSVADAIHDRIKAKSSKGSNYSENTHLIVWCNMDGDMDVDERYGSVKQGAFNIVNIIAFHSPTRRYCSFLFDKDEGLIQEFSIDERDLLS